MLELSRCRQRAFRPRPLRAITVIPAKVSIRTTSSSVPEIASSANRQKDGSQTQVRSHSKRLSYPNQTAEPTFLTKEQIVTSSLEETLQNHREHNQDSIVLRKIKSQHKGNSYLLQAANEFQGSRRVALEREIRANDAKWKDYAGSVRSLAPDWMVVGDVSRSIQQPWITLGSYQHTLAQTGLSRLSQEIEAANRYLSPSPQEAQAATTAFKDVQRIVLELMPDVAKVDLIGSRQSQLSHPLSDLDINLVLKEDPARDPASVLRELYRLLRFDRLGSNYKNTLTTRYHAIRARVPLIVLCHLPTGLEYQIQCADSGYGSLEVARGLRAEFPTIEPLFRIIRQMLMMRGLSDGGRGGLTSYPVLNMIAVSLKIHEKKTTRDDVGQQLLDFLQFYSDTDFYANGITHLPSIALRESKVGSVDELLKQDNINDLVAQDPVGSVPVLFNVRKDLRDIHNASVNYQMVLHDPANLYNDLGTASYLIKHVQETFRAARKRVLHYRSLCERQVRGSNAAEKEPSLLAPLIGGDYSLFQLDRSRLSKTVGTPDGPAYSDIDPGVS